MISIGICVVLGVGLILVGGICCYKIVVNYKQEVNNVKELLQQTRTQNDLIMQENENRMNRINELTIMLEDKNAELGIANKHVEQANVAAWNKDKLVAELTGKVDNLRQQLNEMHLAENYDESAEKMKNLVAELDQQYYEKNKNLAILEEKIREKTEGLEFINLKYQNTQNSILCTQSEAAILVAKNEQLEKDIQINWNQFNQLTSELEAMKKSYVLVLSETMREKGLDEEEGWVFHAGDREPHFIKLIHELVEMYPELRMDLASIEWKKVWLPKIQDLCNREGLDKKMGIYKLTLLEDEDVCYIGQAVNIKERWYTHFRKMIGVESKGNEKLYEYKPNQLRWRLLEEVSDRSKLNDREKYWIEFFGCKEWGLNKKR